MEIDYRFTDIRPKSVKTRRKSMFRDMIDEFMASDMPTIEINAKSVEEAKKIGANLNSYINRHNLHLAVYVRLNRVYVIRA